MTHLDEGEGPAGAQEPRRLRVPRVRIDPVERREGDDGVEGRLVRLPVLERGVDNLDARELRELAARVVGEAGPELDADDGEPAFGERGGRLPGARPDLDDAPARRDPHQLDEVVDQLGRVRRTSPFVQLGHLLERRTQPPPRGHREMIGSGAPGQSTRRRRYSTWGRVGSPSGTLLARHTSP